jgi:hypothetical protein
MKNPKIELGNMTIGFNAQWVKDTFKSVDDFVAYAKKEKPDAIKQAKGDDAPFRDYYNLVSPKKEQAQAQAKKEGDKK